MPNNSQDTLTLPSYESLKSFEGKGNYAIWKYYAWPYRYFYRHKLKMIVDLLGEKKYENILDYGAGPGIFTDELKKHAWRVKSIDKSDPIDPRWKFDVIVCASVLEFCVIPFTLDLLSVILAPRGFLIVASPMDTIFSKLYFKSINDKLVRNSHKKIIDSISQKFTIYRKEEWLGLYFSVKAQKRR